MCEIQIHYHMLPVINSAPRGKFRALSLYNFLGLSPRNKQSNQSVMRNNIVFSTLKMKRYSLLPCQMAHQHILDVSLTVDRVEGVCILFIGGLGPADDLEHGALGLGCLGGKGVVVWVLIFVCLRTAAKMEKKHTTPYLIFLQNCICSC